VAATFGSRRHVYRFLAAGWGLILAVLFAGVTALTLSVGAIDPAGAKTPPVADLSFFVLGASVAVGCLAQWRNPVGRVAGLQQGLVASALLLGAGAFGLRIEPALGGLVVLAVTGLLAAVHPARGQLFEPAKDAGQGPVRIQRLALAVLSVGALVPASLLATGLLKDAASSGPSCFLGQCSFGDRLAEMAAALVAVPLFGLLAAAGSSGWRLPLWTAGLGAGIIGAGSVAFPGTTVSLGLGGGVAALVWGASVLLIAIAWPTAVAKDQR